MAFLTNIISFIVFYLICSSLGDEIQLTLDDEALKSLDLHPLIREERQYNHGGMMNMPYPGQPGMMNNGQYYGQPGMYPMGPNAGYNGNMQPFPHQKGFNQGMTPGGNGGLFGTLLNPLSMMGNLMGSGRSAQHFQKEMIPPLSPTHPAIHDDHVVDNVHHYSSNVYPGGCPCMSPSYRTSVPVASYILSSPYRKQKWMY